MEIHNEDFRCSDCGKLLNKSLLKVEKNGPISDDEFANYRRKIKISHGYQVKCRRCKSLRQTLKTVEFTT